ncbi:MAG: AraC family transcriptional regulator [Fimbriimonadaceae bacterium]
MVDRIWRVDARRLNAPAAWQVPPDGCCDLIRTPDGKWFLTNPTVRWQQVPILPGEVWSGIRFSPACASALWQGHIGAAAVEAETLAALADKILEGGPGAGTVSSLAHDEVVVLALARMKAANPPSLASLAHELALSLRSLERRFLRATGLTMSTYARIARLQRAMPTLAGSMPLGQVAVEAGYAHPSHFVRELHGFGAGAPSAARTRLQSAKNVGFVQADDVFSP